MNPILRFARHVNSMIICSITGAYIYIKLNSFEKCKLMLESRKDDLSLFIPPQMQKLVNEVMNEMKLKPKEKSQVKLFLCETPDFQRFGSSIEPQGALLGIPQYFVIDENTDINSVTVSNTLFVNKESQQLDESLHLSYEAKKFAVARELYEVFNSNDHILHIFPAALSLSCYFFSYLREKFSQKNLSKKRVYYSHFLLFLLGAVLYIAAFDLIILYTETNADFLACDLGKSYINGGIEYYKKIIKKNIALKKMDKNTPCSANGEIQYSIFGKHHMPLQKRLSYLGDILNTKKEKPSLWRYVMTAH